MTSQTVIAEACSTHVEACCCTGTSPGCTGHVRAPIDLDGGSPIVVDIGYELYGADRDPPTVVLGGISADRHLAASACAPAPGWWPGVVGPGAALDPDHRRLLGIDYVTPQASAHAASRITSRDQARALSVVLDALDVDDVVLVGASYGGMVGLAFADLFPSRVIELVVICAAHRTHPMATALRAIQRRVASMTTGSPCLETGLSLARALAMTTYRSAREFDARFDWRVSDDRGAPRFQVEDYLDARGEDFATRFSTEGFVSLSESIDLHAVDPSSITVPTTLVSVDSDTVVPPWLVEELAQKAPGVLRHVTLESIYGHDAFLKEVGLLADVLRSTLPLGGAR